MNKIGMKRISGFTLIALATCICQFVPGLSSSADVINYQQKDKKAVGASLNPRKSAKPGENYHRDRNEFRGYDLVQIPRLPDLPLYTGNNVQFAWGEEFPNARGGKVVAYNFSTTDPQVRILQWYEQYLAAEGWEVEVQCDAADGEIGCLSANKGRSLCRITTQSSGDKRVAVRVHYHGMDS